MTVQDICLDDVIEGAVNFRDLGGLPAEPGTIRRGVVYRSGMTHHITEAGLQCLAKQYGLRTVIDLRSQQELDNGLATWQTAGIAHHHVPVLATTEASVEEVSQRFVEMKSGSFDWAGMYVKMLEEGAPAFRQVFLLLAQDEGTPAVFHCAGGRDRTGVTAALLLSSAGVANDVIARDYALTGTYLSPHVDRFTFQSERMNMTRDEMARMLVTTEEAMLRFLDLLSEQHGSVTGYLGSIGVEEDTIITLRERLIEAA
jgi:protein-tyrosine phosphatase